MRSTNPIFNEHLVPGAVVSETFVVPDCAECAVIICAANDALAPKTPVSVQVLCAYDTPPSIWVEVGRLNGGVQPGEIYSKRIDIGVLAAHVRVVAGGNQGAAASASALIVSR